MQALIAAEFDELLSAEAVQFGLENWTRFMRFGNQKINEAPLIARELMAGEMMSWLPVIIDLYRFKGDAGQ